MRFVECVPNLSEGRRPEVVEAIVAAARAVPGAHVLGHEMDPDHNRAVVTLAGDPRAVMEAVLALFEAALPRIDLARHEGVHPRVGAIDVVPFVPLEGTTMDDCLELARSAGRRIAERFGIPVFLYEQAATRPERRHLSEIRRGGASGLAARMASGDASWAPDFGPPEPHPTAGVVAVGAREFLVAYNVELETEDLEVARRIAARVRESEGGLPGVKALGLATPTRGCVQVSMNLYDLTRTGIAAAFARVAELAVAEGVSVRGGELVGLVPRAAVAEAFGAAFARRGFGPDRVIEDRLERLVDPLEAPALFLEALASTRPPPGGGSAAARARALAAGLAEKAARISARKKPAEGLLLLAIADRAAAVRLACERAVREDADAFAALLAAYRTRDAAAIRAATLRAGLVPTAVVERLADLAADLGPLSRLAHPDLASDARCAAELARGAAGAAEATARINLEPLGEGVDRLEAALGRLDRSTGSPPRKPLA